MAKETSEKEYFSRHRRGSRSHLDSDETFLGAESPTRPADPCGKEDTPGRLSYLCHMTVPERDAGP